MFVHAGQPACHVAWVHVLGTLMADHINMTSILLEAVKIKELNSSAQVL